MSPLIDGIWTSIDRKATKFRRAQINPLRNFLWQTANPHARVLSGRPTTGKPEESSARALEALVAEQYQKNRISKLEVAAWLGLIRLAVDAANKNGESMAPTRLAAVAPPAPSPFSPAAMHGASRVTPWLDALNSWIRQNEPASKADWQLAILMSAVLNGSLLDPTKIHLLLEALNTSPVREAFGIYSYSFNLPYRGLGFHHLQRWQPDPITLMLVWRMPTEGVDLQPNEINPRLQQLLSHRNVRETALPRNLKDFVDAAITWWSAKAMQADIGGSAREFATHSFHRRTWARLMARPYDPRDGRVFSRTPSAGIPVEEDDFQELPTIHTWLDEAMRALDGVDPAQVSAEIDLISHGYSTTPAKTYLNWMASALVEQSSRGSVLKIGTVRRRLRAAVPRLLAMLGTDDPASLETESLEDIYGELTSDPAPETPITDLVGGLRDFHGWLVRNHGKARIRREQEVFGDDGGVIPVDANLPSLEEYLKAQRWLEQRVAFGWSEQEIRTCKVIMMLAFKAGLRRMEILGLRLADLQIHRGIVCIVRPHRTRRLKTKASARVIPVSILISTDERLLLRRYIEERRRKTGYQKLFKGSDEYLFPEFQLPNRLSWADRVCDKVCLAIREATGDHRLFLHHLRHACATWLYLRLRAADLPEVAFTFEHLPATTIALRQGRRLRLLLLNRNDSVSRRYSFAVARILGHSTPGVSFQHYIHAAEVILGALVWRAASSMDRQVVVAASGLSKSAGYENLNKGLRELVEVARSRHMAECSVSPPTGLPQDSNKRRRGRPRKGVDPRSPTWTGFDMAMRVLTLRVEVGKPDDFIAEHLDIPIARVREITGLATRWGPAIGLPVESEQLSEAPRGPRGDRERIFFDEVERRFARLAEKDPGELIAGVELHLTHVNRQHGDAVFRGDKDRLALKRYLRFLQNLGFEAGLFNWVVRLPKDLPLALPDWTFSQSRDWFPEAIRRVNPPVAAKSASYAKWAGVIPADAKNRSMGGLFGIVCFLGRISLPASN